LVPVVYYAVDAVKGRFDTWKGAKTTRAAARTN